ncbi:unnamed protein product [Adineta ricciae]|nr:unnamed protein product [Adineta ricciae]
MRTPEELEFINAAFQTPFWIKLKQWFTIFQYHNEPTVEFRIYTIPICTSTFLHNPGFAQLPSPATSMRTEHNNIEAIIVDKRNIDDTALEREDMRENYFHFRKVAYLIVNLYSSWSALLVSTTFKAIDITKIGSCLEEAHSLQSLTISNFLYENGTPIPFESICSIFPCGVQQLDIWMNNVAQIKIIIQSIEFIGMDRKQ